MKTFATNACLAGALVAQLLGGCAADTTSSAVAKPTDGKADAVTRLCTDAGEPADCDICALQNWYNDGTCDDFCSSPDPDCGAAPPVEVTCLTASDLGETSADLRSISGRGRRVTYASIGALPAIRVEQILAAVIRDYPYLAGEMDEVVFAEADRGEFFLEELTFGGEVFDWIQWWAGDTEVGTVFEGGTTRVVASISDGGVRGCTSPDPTPTSVTYACGFDTAHPFGEFSYDLDPVSSATYGRAHIASIPDITAEQILAAARHQDYTDVADLNAAFDTTDDGEFDVIRLLVGGQSYYWVRWWAGDTEVGVIFEAGSVTIVAEIGDQQVRGCEFVR